MFARGTGHNSGKWPVPGNKAGVVQEDSVVSALCRCACLAIISHADGTYFSLPQLCSNRLQRHSQQYPDSLSNDIVHVDFITSFSQSKSFSMSGPVSFLLL